jgi:hypothetical protein
MIDATGHWFMTAMIALLVAVTAWNQIDELMANGRSIKRPTVFHCGRDQQPCRIDLSQPR